MEEKNINSMNIEELRTAYKECRDEADGLKDQVYDLNQKLDKEKEDKESYKRWWNQANAEKELTDKKLEAIKQMVNVL